MLKSIQVELQIHGQRGSSAHVTQLLGVSPDEQYEIGDPKGGGPRTFDVAIWNLFSNRHVEEIRAEHEQAPLGTRALDLAAVARRCSGPVRASA
ncbi:DUF4279 domain-containing protein [Curtobacterium flaccumfaciens pv. flaccumfaciens]|uniref:DUF4279 domain-containing protein n=1 Tax=Curtobacterium poinsettiae TaxID=159612 RepID=UPI00217E4F76|nr:DUF4279 domain-containing protein [Curtobacterium flaccumfaciens]MCS6576366.1 DUF4279 domain-containing protein [Curtobacterium flaccumfaciens pv. flaccumfaciens]